MSPNCETESYGETVGGHETALIALRGAITANGVLLNCRQDDSFLLRFLRYHHFNVTSAHTALVKYIKMRDRNPQFFKNLDYTHPVIEDLLDKGFCYPLSQTDGSGSLNLFYTSRPLKDPATQGNGVAIRAFFTSIETLLEDERNQVNGINLVIDEKDITLTVLAVHSLFELETVMTASLKHMAVNYVHIHVINVPKVLTFALHFVLAFLPERIQRKVIIHRNIEALHKCISKDILPKELGGNVEQEQLIRDFRQTLAQKRSALLSTDSISLKTGQSKRGFFMSSAIKSFRHLNID